MKLLGIVLLIGLSTVATAKELPKDIVGLSQVGGSVEKIDQVQCPDGAFCFVPDSTVIGLKFYLSGCLDEIGPVDYKVMESSETRLKLMVSAIQISTEGSFSARCKKPKESYHEIRYFGKGYPAHQVEVEFMGQTPQRPLTESVIHAPSIEVIPAGINPDAFAYKVSAQVMVGTNPCFAQGVSAQLSQTQGEGILRLRASVKGVDEQRICTMEFNPQYQQVEFTLRGFKSEISEILIANVEEMGLDMTLEDVQEADFTDPARGFVE